MEVPIVIYAALILAAAIFLGAVVRAYGENPNAVGRYQFHGGMNGECRLLDTKTGALWERSAGSVDWARIDGPWALKK